MGFTGSGKTTLIDLILGLLKPAIGEIFIDNYKLGNNNLNSWQQSMGYVPQNIYISDDTLESNIAFGLKKKQLIMKELKDG